MDKYRASKRKCEHFGTVYFIEEYKTVFWFFKKWVVIDTTVTPNKNVCEGEAKKMNME